MELVYSAVLRILDYFLHLDMIAALKLQAEEVPLLAGMEEEFGAIVFDLNYSGLVQACEFEQHRIIAADCELAARLTREARFDGANLRFAQQEEQNRIDHELARRIARVQNDVDVLTTIEEHGRNVVTEVWPAENDGSETSKTTSTCEPDEYHECMVCMDQALDTITLPCEHKYCFACLRGLFCAVLNDSSMLPVTCCQKAVPQETVQKVLTKEEENLVISRLQEKLTTSKMYCASLACSKLIDLDYLTVRGSAVPTNGIFNCVHCGLSLCLYCKSSAAVHGSGPCDGVRADEEALVVLASREGWKRCPGRMTFVSLKSGCNHITCICGYEFCFECGVPWAKPKPCTCVLYTEEMLLRENDRRIEYLQDQLGRDLYGAERANIWLNLNQQNVLSDECSHRDKKTLEYREFARGKKSRACDNCDQPLPLFCYECTECNMRFCKVCRFNRRLV